MTKKETIFLILNSLLLFVAAYIVSYLPFLYGTYYLAKFFSINVEIKDYAVKFLISDASPLWTNFSIITIFGIPPFLALALAYLSRRVYKKYAKRRRGNFRLLLIWISLCFDNLFWGAMIAGIITISGFAYFLNWLYIPFIVQVIVAGLGAILFATLSSFLSASFIQTTPSRYMIDRDNQLSYKIKIIYIPLIIGLGLVFMLNFPNNSIHNLILKATILLPSFRTIIHVDEDNIKLVKNSRVFSPEWLALIGIIAFFIGFNILYH